MADPLSIAEDDIKRSRYMRSLLHAPEPTRVGATRAIPRRLVQYWDDSPAIPADVEECMTSWSPLEVRGFIRTIFNRHTALEYIAGFYSDRHIAAFEACAHPAMRSDYFRLCFVAQEGGFYVDADDHYLGGDISQVFADDRLKLQPMCYDTATETMVRSEVFTRPDRHEDGWIYYVNNNPLIAPSAHPVVRLALHRATSALLHRGWRRRDIQSIAGPGNLTLSLVYQATSLGVDAARVSLLRNWDAIAESRWPLSYRNDARNWRIWAGRR